MIKTIRLQAYKRFQDFQVSARKGNILVGPNNSGKSSILDALRLLDLAQRQTKKNPIYIEIGGAGFRGYKIPDAALPFTIENSVRNYSDDDAKITITHENGNKAIFLINPDRSTRFYIETKSGQPKTALAYRNSFPIDLLVVPTLGPLEIDERVRKIETIEKNIGTRIAARNFRNIWKFKPPSDFSEFQRRISSVWPEVTIEKPTVNMGTPQYLTMFFKEGRIPREIQWAGFRFQIWLQLQTHLARATPNSILVLDEPDIYLHPELQHALYHDVSTQFKQFFIATHATEIINESPTRDLVVIDTSASRGRRIVNESRYMGMLDYIGSAQNADFARISRAKKVIFVEGNDAKLLRMFARRFGFEKVSSSNRTPIQELGGFTQSGRAKATVWAFKELLGVEVETVCLFDKDYRCDEEVIEFKKDMESGKQECFVLKRKEIENYICDSKAICLAINKRVAKGNKSYFATNERVSEMLAEIIESFKSECSSQLLADYIKFHSLNSKATDTSSHIKTASQRFDSKWSKSDGKLAVAPGKEVLKKLMADIQDEFSVSVTANMVINEISLDTDHDLLDFLKFAENFMK